MFDNAFGGLDAIAGGGLSIDLDVTLFFQMGLFIFLWLFLTATVFRPYLAARREREHQTDGTKAEASTLRQEVETGVAELEARLAEARQVATKRRTALVKSGATQADTLISTARDESSLVLENAHVALDKEVVAAKKELTPHANGLSVAIAERILA